MEKTELYLKTIFCCMACDGEIANEEVDMVRHLSRESDVFHDLDVERLINKWISEINNFGKSFLNHFLKELSKAELEENEQLLIIDFSLKTIEADKRIEYSEIKFFKKIRNCLSINDEKILEHYPDIEDFLLPDIRDSEEIDLDNIQFIKISL